MVDQKFSLRLCKKNGSWLVFLFNDKESAQKIYDLISDMRGKCGAPGGDAFDPILDFHDDYGYSVSPNVGDIDTVLLVGLSDATRVQNELNYAAAKGQMHLNALVEADPQLKAFLTRQQGRSIIVPADTAMKFSP